MTKTLEKRLDQVAREINRVAAKLNDPKIFEQKKNYRRKFLYETYIPHTAWVQSFEKPPRLLRNSGIAFVSNPLIYGPCRRSGLSDYLAYKFARRSGPCLCFLDIEVPAAPQHKMFKEDFETGLTRKLTRREQEADNQEQNSGQNSPTKRRTKPTGRRTGKGNKPRGLSKTIEKSNAKKSRKKPHQRTQP